MNQHRDTEQLLDAWMRDGPTVAPDRVLDVVVDRIERQGQRPAWRLDWRRYTDEPDVSRLAAAALAVVIVAVIGYNLLPPGRPASAVPPPHRQPVHRRRPRPRRRQCSSRTFTCQAGGVTVQSTRRLERWTATDPYSWSRAGPARRSRGPGQAGYDPGSTSRPVRRCPGRRLPDNVRPSGSRRNDSRTRRPSGLRRG